MIKFLLITLLAWFVISRLLRLKVIVYKGGSQNTNFDRAYSGKERKEGTLRVDKEPNKSQGSRNPKEGDYVDYEEV